MMQARWQLQDLVQPLGAECVGRVAPATPIAGVGTDTRRLPADCLFVALRGPNFNGHTFVHDAIAKGAVAVLVDRRAIREDPDLNALPVPALVVDDTLRGLGDLATYDRLCIGCRVAAVTGSNGKTTTKELVAAALAVGGAVHKTQGNFNNLVGVPLTLLACPPDAWAAVIEMGMNAPGEIARLTQIAAPNVGVVTNVAPAHLEGLGSIESVAQAKGELYVGLRAGAVAVVNDDDPMLRDSCRDVLALRQVIRFGRGAACDVRVVGHEPKGGGTQIDLAVRGRRLRFRLNLLGGHNAMNAAAALAVADALGVDVEAAAERLAQVRLPGGRLRLEHAAAYDVAVVDDSYNANPGSMRAALEALQDAAPAARRIAVLGDMFELGERAAQWHWQVGQHAARCGVQWVLAFGPLAEQTAAGARQAGGRGEAFDSLESLLAALDQGLQRGDWVLVKGSRGMRMERVVQALMERPN